MATNQQNRIKLYTKESLFTHFSKAIWSETFEDYYGIMLGIPQQMTLGELLEKGYTHWHSEDDANGDGHGIDKDTILDAIYEVCTKAGIETDLQGALTVYINGDGLTVFVCMDHKCNCIIVPYFEED